MKKLACYSFKGGTGRTTSTANIGAALANRGKNVLLLDLDIESPGLAAVLGVDRDVHKNNCIQSYFNMTTPSHLNIKDILIDLKSEGGQRTENFHNLSGAFYLIPAHIGMDPDTVVEYGEENRISKLLSRLFRRIEESDLEIDYILLDTAGGYSEMSAATFSVAEEIYIFFRWSKQHILGTVAVSKFFNLIKSKGIDFTYHFIANCVPRVATEKDEIVKSVRMNFLKDNIGKEVLQSLPESVTMKWDERVLIGVEDDNDDTSKLSSAFMELADTIVKQ